MTTGSVLTLWGGGAAERLALEGQWNGENFRRWQQVNQELSQLSLSQVQSLTSFDFILDALLQAAF